MTSTQQKIDKSYYDDSINALVGKYDSQFGGFYRSFLYRYSVDLDKILHQKEFSSNCVDIQTLKEEQMSSMLFEIYPIALKVLIVEMYELRDDGLLKGVDGKARYQSFAELLLRGDYVDQILAKYPVLKRLLEIRIAFRIDYLNEVISDYIADQDVVADTFELSSAKIVMLKMSDGDSHNGGKKVVEITFENSTKILYKPHSLSADEAYARAINYLNGINRIKYHLKHLRIESKDRYGWQEFAEVEACQHERSADRYYYRIGASLAIFYVLASHDLHYENLIAGGEYPHFIDLETIIKALQDRESYGSNPSEIFHSELHTSILGSILLPTNYIPSFFEFDMGGISANHNYKKTQKFYSFQIMNEGTDSLRLEKYEFCGNVSNRNLLKLGNEVAVARYYSDSIAKGYDDAFTAIFENREEFLKVLFSQPIIARQVFRPTMVYARLLEASTFPSYLRSEEDFRKLFMKLESSRGREQESSGAEILQSEIHSLLNFDVPCFTSSTEDGALRSWNMRVEDFYQAGLIEKIENRFNRLSLLDIEKQKYYINLSLATQKNEKKFTNPLSFDKKLTQTDWLNNVGLSICHRLAWDDQKSNGVILVNTVSENGVKYSGVDYSLYGGGGIALFLAALWRRTGNERFKEAAAGLFKSAMDNESSSISSIGGMTGTVSVAYTLYVGASLLSEEEYSSWSLILIKKIKDDISKGRLILDECKIDLATGLSGAAIMLYNMYDDSQSEEYLNLANEIANEIDELSRNTQMVDELEPGLAHGVSGIAWALALALTENDDVNSDHVITLLGKENEKKSFFTRLSNHTCNEGSLFWCNGELGIAFARKLIMNILRKKCETVYFSADEIMDMFSCVPKMGNHSMCHGKYGALVCLSEILNDASEDLRARCTYVENAVLEDVLKNGVNLGHADLIEDYTFMLGLSGIGYEILREADKTYPNILKFEVGLRG